MPSWLQKLLQERDGRAKDVNRPNVEGNLLNTKGSENHAYGVLPVLAQLLDQDPCTAVAYLCNPNVLHISKLRREGKSLDASLVQAMTC